MVVAGPEGLCPRSGAVRGKGAYRWMSCRFAQAAFPCVCRRDEPQAGTQDIRESCKGCGGVLLRAGKPLRRLLQCRYRRDAEYIAIALTGIHGLYGSFSQSRVLRGFHPERVIFANLGVNVPVCLHGDLEVASAQTLDFIDMGKKTSFPDWKPGRTGKSFPQMDTQRSFPGSRRRRSSGSPRGRSETPADRRRNL